VKKGQYKNYVYRDNLVRHLTQEEKPEQQCIAQEQQ